MKLQSILRITVIVTVFAAATLNVDAARRVILRRLSGEEVVRVLKLAGREDAIPEGRVITQGLAAITGFALGLTKGIGGSFLFDLATSNATSNFINSFNFTGISNDFNRINITALKPKYPWSFTNNNSTTTRFKTTEICFDTSSKGGMMGANGRQSTDSQVVIGTINEVDTGNTDDNNEDNTDNDDGMTCIALQTPILRKRRSSLRKHRR